METLEVEFCKTCGRPLTNDDIGMTKKIVNRGATSYFCLQCLAKDFGVTEDTLKKMIVRFRKQGCTLFPPLDNN